MITLNVKSHGYVQANHRHRIQNAISTEIRFCRVCYELLKPNQTVTASRYQQ